MNLHFDKQVESKAKKILQKINSNPNTWLIFGLNDCKYCKNAVTYSTEKNLQFKYYSVDNYYDYFLNILKKLSELKPYLQIDPNHQTFPAIFYNGKFIGGYSELVAKLNSHS